MLPQVCVSFLYDFFHNKKIYKKYKKNEIDDFKIFLILKASENTEFLLKIEKKLEIKCKKRETRDQMRPKKYFYIFTECFSV